MPSHTTVKRDRNTTLLKQMLGVASSNVDPNTGPRNLRAQQLGATRFLESNFGSVGQAQETLDLGQRLRSLADESRSIPSGTVNTVIGGQPAVLGTKLAQQNIRNAPEIPSPFFDAPGVNSNRREDVRNSQFARNLQREFQLLGETTRTNRNRATEISRKLEARASSLAAGTRPDQTQLHGLNAAVFNNTRRRRRSDSSAPRIAGLLEDQRGGVL